MKTCMLVSLWRPTRGARMAVCDIYGICVLYVIERGMDAYV
jgi:hypothetical protein